MIAIERKILVLSGGAYWFDRHDDTVYEGLSIDRGIGFGFGMSWFKKLEYRTGTGNKPHRIALNATT
jgi:hypothetical protein